MDLMKFKVKIGNLPIFDCFERKNGITTVNTASCRVCFVELRYLYEVGAVGDDRMINIGLRCVGKVGRLKR